MKHTTAILAMSLLCLISSCKTNVTIDEVESVQEGSISIEQALSRLETFYNAAYPNTKTHKQIESISKYTDEVRTKSGEEKSVYLVNYSENSGFAVLAAEPSVADIVAVVETGHINDDLSVSSSAESTLIVADETTYYCEEDGDYYSDAAIADTLVSDIIKSCIKFGDEDNHSSNITIRPYVEKKPLLKISWGQTDTVYSKYCRCVLSDNPALCGCSSTALAMIMATLEFPQTLFINGDCISWSDIKVTPQATDLTNSVSREYVSKLCGMVFNYVKPNMITSSGNFTMITPQQIKNIMSLIGFENIKKHCANSLNEAMLKSISAMLSRNKPVFISAVPDAFWFAHSWVVDGAKYSSPTSSNYLLHFNFGWQGCCNGYFSVSGLNPANAVSYDNPQKDNQQNDYTYLYGFRLLTYDIPVGHLTIQLDYTW